MVEASVRGLVDENGALPEEGYESLGLPSIAASRVVVESALEELVLPGFARLGIDTTDVRTSAARGWR
jgi:hypothetical protein